MLANIGVMLAQLSLLQQPDSGFGYSAVGKPAATVCLSGSLATTLLGAVRTWRFQRALVRGRALVGGMEMMLVGICYLLVRPGSQVGQNPSPALETVPRVSTASPTGIAFVFRFIHGHRRHEGVFGLLISKASTTREPAKLPHISVVATRHSRRVGISGATPPHA